MPAPFTDPLLRLRRRSLAALLAILLVLGSVLLLAPRTNARSVGQGRFVTVTDTTGSRGMWLGGVEAPLNSDSHAPAWCIHMFRSTPDPRQKATITPLEDSAQWGPEELDLTSSQMAWLLDAHQEESSAQNRAALAYLVHVNFEGESPGRDTAQEVSKLVSSVRTQAADVDELAQKYVLEARENAAISYETGTVSGEKSAKGTISSLGVRSEKGWIASRAITAKLEGPAVFEESNTSTWEGITRREGNDLHWRATGNGQVTLILSYDEPTPPALTKYATGPQIQETVNIGVRPSTGMTRRRIEGPSWQTSRDFQVRARSNVAEAKVLDEPVLHDRVSVSADPNYADGTWPQIAGRPVPIVFTGTAYRVGEVPAHTSQKVPEDATALGTTTFTAHGPGDYEASLNVDATPGFVTWVWSAKRDTQGDMSERSENTQISTLLASTWSDAFGLPDETSSIRGHIDIDTAISTRTTKSGTYLVDDLFIRGFPQNHPHFPGGSGFKADTPTITHTLLFFPQGLEVSQKNRRRAEVIGSVNIPATNGVHASVGANNYLIDGRPGTYVFVSEFSGDDRVRPFASSIEDSAEQYTVSAHHAPRDLAPRDEAPVPETSQSSHARPEKPQSVTPPQSAPVPDTRVNEAPESSATQQKTPHATHAIARTGATAAPLLLLSGLIAFAGGALTFTSRRHARGRRR